MEKEHKIDSTLGIGPMSSEVIEAVFRYSNYYRKPLMLIASKNQIDWRGGYVNGWDTAQFMEFIKRMRQVYDNSDVKICRDHCGPGFNGVYDLDDTYKTIEDDIKNGFDLIHIDFCHFRGSKDEQFEASKKAIEHCLSLKPDIFLEVGTDENAGVSYNLSNAEEIEREMDFFKSFCSPDFYVVQTGSLTKEINQVGKFNKQFVEKISRICSDKGMSLKEHNGDYLDKDQLALRKGIVNAINIAPQLGVVQTNFVLSRCLMYGIDFGDFIKEAYHGKKWQKWLHGSDDSNKFLCSLISGHYHFTSDSYKRIIEQLGRVEDIRELIINELMSVIDHYEI